MTGTWVNVAAVVAGSVIGMLVHHRLPRRHQDIAFHGMGLITLYLGVSMALKSHNPLVLILSVLFGAILGESLRIEAGVEALAEALKKRVAANHAHFSEGLITAFLIFCMGSLTIIGAMEEGMGHGPELLLAKSALDGFASIALAATFGVGVLFSALPLLLYQGLWTLIGYSLSTVLSTTTIDEISAVGGILLLGLSLRLLDLKEIRLLNLLPALALAPLFVWLLGMLGVG